MIKPAKSVLYTTDLEPITVLSLTDSAWRHFVDYGNYSFNVMDVPTIDYFEVNAPLQYELKEVHVWAEKFVYRDTKTLMLFTYNDANALLLKASFLAGQQRQLNDERADAFARGFLKALTIL